MFGKFYRKLFIFNSNIYDQEINKKKFAYKILVYLANY